MNTKQLLPMSSFNDDDHYLYCIRTLVLIGSYSGKSKPPVPAAGQAVRIGLGAKYLGLWRPVVVLK